LIVKIQGGECIFSALLIFKTKGGRKMKEQRNIISISVLTVFMAIALALFLTGLSIAGSLEPPASAVSESGYPLSTMTTPPSWSQQLPASERFKPLLPVEICFPNPYGPPICLKIYNGILDKETGLVWEQKPDSASMNWDSAQDYCNNLYKGKRKGWRVPTLQELASLVDPDHDPALPAGHPFENVQSLLYWTATTRTDDPNMAWSVWMQGGHAGPDVKIYDRFVWCVRGGQSVDAQ